MHSEYVLLSDIVLATPTTVFQDRPHFGFGIVPGDGIHSLWPHVESVGYGLALEGISAADVARSQAAK